ncbi:translation initiation factor IF-2-like [Mustela putorius furo]|uniref:Translation initiation factor IF-2-like n=1 Tax=Mustela putorius furo TaxID=9669 RepID=A0A8U0RUK6_MUSPF|nr:translation initiation factor IF-2-like [Mustela putorius furo]
MVLAQCTGKVLLYAFPPPPPSEMPPFRDPKQLSVAQTAQAYHLEFPQRGFSSAAPSRGCLGGTSQQHHHPFCSLPASSPLLGLHTEAAFNRRRLAGTAGAAEQPRRSRAAGRGGGGAAGGRARRPTPRATCDADASPTCLPVAPQKPQTPHCVTRRHAASAPAVLAYLQAASPLRPHRRPPASSALQSEGGRFVRAQEAGQYFAAGAAVPGGRPSKGRDWGPARASFPYVRSQRVQKRGSPGLRRASSPPAGPPPGSAARASRTSPSSRPRSRPLPASSPGGAPRAGTAPARAPKGKPQPVPVWGPPWARRALPTARGRREASAHPQAAGPGTPGVGSLLTAFRGSSARRRRGDHGRGRTQGSEAAAAGRPRPARSAPGSAAATRSFGRRGGRARPARGGGARATPAWARLLLRGPRRWGRPREERRAVSRPPRGPSPQPPTRRRLRPGSWGLLGSREHSPGPGLAAA